MCRWRPALSGPVASPLPRRASTVTVGGIGYNSPVAELQYATLWERVADTVPDTLAVVHRGRRMACGAVDDGGAALPVPAAAGFDDLIAASAPMARIARSGDDVYMLYTGGTTGMPKGVMYRHADHAAYIEAIGYGWLGLTPPSGLDDL